MSVHVEFREATGRELEEVLEALRKPEPPPLIRERVTITTPALLALVLLVGLCGLLVWWVTDAWKVIFG